MADSSSVDVILEFLRRNKFTRAEAALRGELGSRPDLNGLIEKLTIEDKNSGKVPESENMDKRDFENQGASNSSTREVSKELIVKEIECGTGRNGSESKWENSASIGARNKMTESIGAGGKQFTFSKSLKDNGLDLHSWNFKPGNGPVDLYQTDGSGNENLSEFQVTGRSRLHSAEATDAGKANAKAEELRNVSGEMKTLWVGSSSKPGINESNLAGELKELDQQLDRSSVPSRDNFVDNPWSRSNEPANSSAVLWKDCSVKTVFPFSKVEASTDYRTAGVVDQKEVRRRTEISEIRAAIKEQVDEVGRALYFGKSKESSEEKDIGSLGFPLASENQKEELPRLPPVKLKSEDKPLSIHWDGKVDHDEPGSKITAADNAFLIGSYLDVPVGQEISSAGGKRAGGSWLSVSQGIAEDTSDLVSGFATIGDGVSESVDYPNEYWDSDEYDDDDDVGYMRQPIEDETWFLAHEIDYPSDNEKGTAGHGGVPDPQERGPTKDEDDDQSFAEEDSYFSGERYFQSKSVDPVTASDDPIGLSVTEMYGRTDENDLMARYDGQLMDEEELNLMRAEPVWQGFVTQSNELIMIGEGTLLNDCGRPRRDDICMDDDHHGSVRSIGVGINSDAADMGSEVRESLVGGSSEGDLDYFHEHDIVVSGSRNLVHDSDKKHLDRSSRGKSNINQHDTVKYIMGNDKVEGKQVKKSLTDGGFSFPPPRDGQLVQKGSSKSLWSNKCSAVMGDETDDCLNAPIGPDDMLSSWRRKSSDSSPVESSRDENNGNLVGSENSTPSTLSDYEYAEKKEEHGKAACITEEELGVSMEDEEAVAVQEQVKQIKAQEEEFETFNLKIVHRKNRTGFEEDKNFHVVLNSVIAGRYHVTEYLGSAAFSKAIQAHDLHTGMDVCVKIIKNNKDFFDQSLDEIKLLKFVNKHDPGDKYHLLRLYDYFYYRVSLDAAKVVNVTPRYARLRAGANGSAKGQIIGWENIELISDRPLETMLKEFKQLKEEYPDRVLIASIMEEYDKAAWEELIDRVEQTGVDAIEINFSCPHGMPERKMGAAVGQDCALLEEVCGWINAKATVPVWAKMTPNITDITQPAKVALRSGCEGISAINTIMSVMGINLNTLHPEPCVEGYSTPGGYSAKAVHPIALAKVMSIAQMMKAEYGGKDYSLSGIGGVETGGDAAEFILLGSNTVQVCTGVMMHGYGLVKKLCAELQDFMTMHNFSSIEDFRGVSLQYFTTHTDLVQRQQAAIQQRKAVRKGLQSDKDWTGDGFVHETETMVSN